jgi:hypothetical protein
MQNTILMRSMFGLAIMAGAAAFAANTVLATETATENTTNQTNAVCPTDRSAQLLTWGPDLDGANANESYTVNFTVAPGCELPLTLMSFTVDGPGGLSDQSVYKSATGTFAAGSHSLTVATPNCYYQLDFAFGGVRQDAYFGDDLIDADTGGDHYCTGAVATPTPTPTPTVLGATVTPTPTITATQLPATGPGMALPILLAGTVFALIGKKFATN